MSDKNISSYYTGIEEVDKQLSRLYALQTKMERWYSMHPQYGLTNPHIQARRLLTQIHARQDFRLRARVTMPEDILVALERKVEELIENG